MDQRENNKAVPEIEAVKIPLLGVKLNPLFFVLVWFWGFFLGFFPLLQRACWLQSNCEGA